MQTLFLDGSAGVSGNMLLGLYLDLGLPINEFIAVMRQIPIPPFEIKADVVYKCGIRATHCTVIPSERSEEKGVAEFVDAIEKSKLPEYQKEKGVKMFRRLAEVEGYIHGKAPEDVHFHELGGWDTLIDVMGSVIALDILKISNIVVGPLNVGSGSVNTCHGKLPVPAPATVELLKGFTTYTTGLEAELVTPTGALIVSSLGSPDKQPLMKTESVGYGAGTMDLPIPNCLRGLLGTKLDSSNDSENIMLLECNLDNMNPEWLDYCMECLYGRGALEVFFTPVFMKKNRPGVLLTVLAPCDKKEELCKIIFQETTTLGVRFKEWSRHTLTRKVVSVETGWGAVRMKEGWLDGKIVNITPEYDDVKTIAARANISIKAVSGAAYSGYQKFSITTSP